MHSVLLPVLVASGVAAQHLAGIPELPNLAAIAKVNPGDPGYKVCTAAADVLQECINEFGGPVAFQTASPVKVAACACCHSGAPVAISYSSCASYLSAERQTGAAAYETLYEICNNEACSGGGGGAVPTQTSASAQASITSQYSLTAAPTATPASGSATGSISYDPACLSVLGYYESCSNAIPGFTNLPFPEQAPCYCCVTFHGTASWTDRLDVEASSCAIWAKTGDPKTMYSVATSYAHFCSKFSNACAATAQAVPTQTADDSTTTTDSSTSKKTAAGAPAATTTAKKDAAASLRSNGVVGVAALAALVVLL